jgi:hypothetical protein
MNSFKSLVLAVSLMLSLPAFAADLAIVKSGVGKGISGKELVDEAATFKVGDKVYALFLVTNPGGAEPAKVIWKHDGKVKGELEVTIGTSKTGWKTYGQHKLGRKAVGAWTCELATEDGTAIATASFTVE